MSVGGNGYKSQHYKEDYKLKMSEVKNLIGREFTQMFLEDETKDYRQTVIDGYEEYKKKGNEAIRILALMDVLPVLTGMASPNDIISSFMVLWAYSGNDVEEYAKILEAYITHFTEFVAKHNKD